MKLDKIIYSIKDAIKEYNDDSNFSDRYITYLLDIKRAKYIKQLLLKENNTIDSNIVQEVCLKVTLTDEFNCDDSDCKKLLKTTVKIPSTFMLSHKDSIINVRTKDKLSRNFENIKQKDINLLEFSTFKNIIYYFIGSDNYLYLYSKNDLFKEIECIVVSGVFESPTELISMSNCCDKKTLDKNYSRIATPPEDEDHNQEHKKTECDYCDYDYPIPSFLIDVVRDDVIKDLLLNLKINEDKENDSTH